MTSLEKISIYLREKGYILSIAESCTGGLISSMFTDIKGASKFIEQNFVTYSNGSKAQLLGVNPDTIKKYGVVSENVAREMVFGLIHRYGADFALSTTGWLDGERAGEVYIGFASKDKNKVFHYISSEKKRVPVKYDIALRAIDFLWECISANNS